jgi:hypothetical protein
MRIAPFALLALVAGCDQSGLPPIAGALDLSVAGLPPDAAPIDQSVPANADLSLVGVTCGASICDTRTGDVCCWGAAATCGPPPCTTPDETIACDGPEDCPAAQVCCFLIAPIFGTACSDSCGQTATQRGRLCHSAADCNPGQQCLQLEATGVLFGCVP